MTPPRPLESFVTSRSLKLELCFSFVHAHTAPLLLARVNTLLCTSLSPQYMTDVKNS